MFYNANQNGLRNTAQSCQGEKIRIDVYFFFCLRKYFCAVVTAVAVVVVDAVVTVVVDAAVAVVVVDAAVVTVVVNSTNFIYFKELSSFFSQSKVQNVDRCVN